MSKIFFVFHFQILENVYSMTRWEKGRVLYAGPNGCLIPRVILMEVLSVNLVMNFMWKYTPTVNYGTLVIESFIFMLIANTKRQIWPCDHGFAVFALCFFSTVRKWGHFLVCQNKKYSFESVFYLYSIHYSYVIKPKVNLIFGICHSCDSKLNNAKFRLWDSSNTRKHNLQDDSMDK